MSTNKVMLIQDNEVIGHSTDTVFGLVAKVDRHNIKKINSLKERAEDQPLQILISSIDVIKECLEENELLNKYIENGFDSNTSYIVKVKRPFATKRLLPSFNNTVMIRIPTGEIKDLLNEVEMLFATSANKHDEEPIKSLEEFNDKFPNVKAFGTVENNKPSKIISLVNNKEELIRE